MDNMDQPSGKCVTCDDRDATTWWVDNEGAATLALCHDMAVPRCEMCCLRDRVEHARKCAAALPGLEAELKRAGEG